MQGTLLKRRDHMPGWRPRTLLLQGSPDFLLLYYIPSSSASSSHSHYHAAPPRGLLPLGGATVRPLSEEEAGGVRHAFRIDHPWAQGVSRSKGWVLAAHSRQEREKWVRALKQGIAEAEAALRRGEREGGEKEGEAKRVAPIAAAVGGGGGNKQEHEGSGEANGRLMPAAGSVPLDQLVLPVSKQGGGCIYVLGRAAQHSAAQRY